MESHKNKLPSAWVSALPLAVLTLLLYVVIRCFGGDAINGGSQIALLSATSVCVMLSIGIYRCKWSVLEDAIIDNIRASASAIIILLLIKPWYAVMFAIFILILQQIDGNVLKPIILGDKLGISGFWILFSVSVGGSLFGILGMFLGVPVFALIYAGIRDLAEMRLKEKNIHLEEKAGT